MAGHFFKNKHQFGWSVWEGESWPVGWAGVLEGGWGEGKKLVMNSVLR